MDIYTNIAIVAVFTLDIFICRHALRCYKRVEALEEKSSADMIQLLDVAEQEYAALWRTIDRMQKEGK